MYYVNHLDILCFIICYSILITSNRVTKKKEVVSSNVGVASTIEYLLWLYVYV